MQRIKTLTHNGRRHLPLPSGPFSVGCCDIMTSYLKFGVFVRLFYPSKVQGVVERYLQWPEWIPHKEYVNGYAVRAGVPPKLYKMLFDLYVGKLYIPAIWQAQLQPTDGKYPVIVFSHGLSGFRTTYSSICLELASHGYVVAAVEHRDHSASASFYKKQARMSAFGSNPGSNLDEIDSLLNVPMEINWEDVVDSKWDPGPRIQDIGPFCHTKEWMLYLNPSKENEMSFRRQQVRYRARECSEALDLLEDLNLGRSVTNILDASFNASMFKDRLDLSNAFFIGHSFGGATGILSLATELRFRAGVLLDPWMFPYFEDQHAFSMISQPFLCLLVQSFQTKQSMKVLKQLQNLHSFGEFVTLKKANHRDLCDTPFVPKVSLSLSSKMGIRIGRFPALDLTVDLILQFLGQQLGGSIKHESEKLECLKEKFLVDEDFSSVDDEKTTCFNI
ncbi:platelet-activating factor acetylhydrolase 2, cytoplasmic-like [Uloborus diversus]|uniref:platelet-activating factor acetylhydrolase 2, cytoplasmic-like n=1 Tax=Uloborus diversus TaxID=327109 RepID=UPI00240A1517|nr:platelet-activating factor acetylhydrolase 2, cytoplasmic-like [Uloborus diversus]